ncbi:MAG: hypothetical protein H0X66_07660 [Verrucomicrobia bacterium]|nr:hypothetical protein [Verrucomicrobiota bacterium]
MKSKLALIAIAAFVSTVATAQVTNVLFETNFENDTAGGSPTVIADGGVWTSFLRNSSYVADSVFVAEDSETFGNSPNKFLRIVSAKHFDLISRLSSPSEVVTLSFRYIGHVNSGDTRWSLWNFYGGDGTLLNNNNRAHVLSQSIVNRQIRGATGNYGSNDVVLNWEVVMNNSASPVTYNDGASTLMATNASVWINGVQVVTNYIFARTVGIGEGSIHGISISADSTSSITMDIDDIKVLEGAHVTPAATPVVVTVGIEGNLIKINWPTTAGKSYQVQYKNDLADVWTDLGGVIVADGSGTEEFAENSSEAKRFYRIKQVD